MNEAGRGKWKRRVFTLLSAAAALILLLHFSALEDSPFSLRYAWQSPSAVSVGADGALTLVDSSRTSVVCLDEQGRVTSRLRGGSTSARSFFYAESAVREGSSVYLAEILYHGNSTCVSRERILRCSLDGRSIETLYQIDYDDIATMPQQYGTIKALSVRGGVVTFARWQRDRVTLCQLENGQATALRTLQTDEGDVVYAAGYSPELDRLAVTTRKGALYWQDTDGQRQRLEYGDGQRILRALSVDQAGRLWVADLTAGQVTVCDNEDTRVGCALSGCAAVDCQSEYIALTDGAMVYYQRSGDATWTALADAPYGPGPLLACWGAWLSAVYLVAVALVLLLRLARQVYRKRQSGKKQSVLLLSVIVLLTAALVSVYVISSYQGRLNGTSERTLKQLSQAIARNGDAGLGDRLLRLNELKDYGNADDQSLRAYLDGVCDDALADGDSLYYVLYRFDDEKMWAVIDYEDTVGTIFPYAALADAPEYQQAIRTGESVLVPQSSDEYGAWSYCVTPLYASSGEMAGLLELGCNLYGELLLSKEMLRQVVSQTVVTLMMVLLLLAELSALAESWAQRRRNHQQQQAMPVPGFARTLMFFVYLGCNLDAAFIPTLSSRLAAGSPLPEGLAAALPMALQLLGVAVAALRMGGWVDRQGARQGVIIGFCAQAAGAALSLGALLLSSYPLFVLAKLLEGLGVGCVVVACNAMLAGIADEREREKQFTALNVGLMSGVVLGAALGGYIAQYLSYPLTYALELILAALAAAGVAGLLKRELHMTKPPLTDAPATGGDMRRFLRRPAVWGFFAFVMMPFMVMLYFKDYLFPLYAASIGLGEATVGNVMLFSGVLAIMLGSTLPGMLMERWGVRKTLLVASVLSVAALLIFSYFQTDVTAILAACLLGVASSFGLAAQSVFYAGQASAAQVGEGRAMGVFSLFDNLGQTLGPLLLGALTLLGYAGASAVSAACGLVLIAAFAWITRKTRKKDNYAAATTDRDPSADA